MTMKDNNTGRAGFGRHVRSLRRPRGLTQERLAESSELSIDTIRRLEHGHFSPSLNTLRKLAFGLDIQLSTLFEGYELNARATQRELTDLLAGRSPRETEFGIKLLRSVYDELDAAREGDGDDD